MKQAVVIIIKNKESEILFLMRNHNPFGYGLPGGKVEDTDESILELYDNDYKGNGEIWNLGEEQPPMLLDPTDIINDITSESYKLIKSFYKYDVTKRSNVPLINHIDEEEIRFSF